MTKTLMIGYGNTDRQDDGAAWHILVDLSQKMSFSPPEELGIPFEFSRGDLAIHFVVQLFPELAETLRFYDRVFFIDTHTDEINEEISINEITTDNKKHRFTHTLSPQILLSIPQSVYSKSPQATMMSVRGYYFGFERQLSP